MSLGQLPPPGAELSVNPLPGVAGAFPDQGVIWLVVWFGPQVGGLVSGALAPPLNWRRKELKGTCGFSAKVVVSCPVCGSALTLPIRRA